MRSMFSLCSSLKNLNLLHFKTNKVNDMRYMFYECSSIETLDLSNFNTENVKNMKCMFSKCLKLINLNINNFCFNNINNSNKDLLIILDISKNQKDSNISNMFENINEKCQIIFGN